mgnify:CR=1 FL=1
MWKRFFGAKKDSTESAKQKEREQENQMSESEEKSTAAMKTIRKNIENLNQE